MERWNEVKNLPAPGVPVIGILAAELVGKAFKVRVYHDGDRWRYASNEPVNGYGRIIRWRSENEYDHCLPDHVQTLYGLVEIGGGITEFELGGEG